MAFVVICCYLLLPAATCCLFHTRDRVPKTQLLSNFLSSISFFFFFFSVCICSILLVNDELLTGAGLLPRPPNELLKNPDLVGLIYNTIEYTDCYHLSFWTQFLDFLHCPLGRCYACDNYSGLFYGNLKIFPSPMLLRTVEKILFVEQYWKYLHFKILT